MNIRPFLRQSPPTPALLLCAGLALAGCNDSGSRADPQGGAPVVPGTPAPTGPENPPPSASAGECTVAGYACAWKDVPLTVIDRSKLLGEQANADLRGGKTVAEVVDWLEQQEPEAVIEHDEGAIRFRLPQGRPVWVVNTGLQPAPLPVTASFAPRALAMKAAAKSAGGVVGPGFASKSALVLAPFRFEDVGTGAPEIAQLLGDTHGYAGAVTYLANDEPDARHAGVAHFDRFAEFDVVYVATYGGTLCASACKGYVAMQRAYDTPTDLINATNPGVELMIFNGDPLLVATDEFFRDAYPHGLDDRFFYFDGNLTANADIVKSLQGANSVFAGWSNVTFGDLSDDVAARMFEDLQTGLSVQEVHARLDQSLGQSVQSTLVTNGRDIRIRDLVIPVDAITGRLIADHQPIEIDGFVGDGQYDNLKMDMSIDGIHPAQEPAGYVVSVRERGTTLKTWDLSEAEKVTDTRYRLEVDVPLGFDAQKDQSLELSFALSLPEGGESVTNLRPVVNDPNQIAQYYTMVTKAMKQSESGYTRMVTTLLWELDPNNSPVAPTVKYVSRGGTMIYESELDIAGCRWVTPPTTVPIPAGESNTNFYIRKGSPPQIEGHAITKGIKVTQTGQCKNGPTDPMTVTLGGIYLHLVDPVPLQRLEGDPPGGFSGVSNDGAQYPFVYEYSFTPGDGSGQAP